MPRFRATTRLKLSKIAVRYEVRLRGGGWVRVRSAYFKDITSQQTASLPDSRAKDAGR